MNVQNIVNLGNFPQGQFFKPCKKRNPGYPLDSISIMPECNKYFVELTEEDRNRNKQEDKEDGVIDFIVSMLKNEN